MVQQAVTILDSGDLFVGIRVDCQEIQLVNHRKLHEVEIILVIKLLAYCIDTGSMGLLIFYIDLYSEQRFFGTGLSDIIEYDVSNYRTFTFHHKC